MTLETMKAVVGELNRKGVPATLEYPGNIACLYVGDPEKRSLIAGDANEYFGCDLMNSDWECIANKDSLIPSDTQDVPAVVDFIISTYTQALSVAQ